MEDSNNIPYQLLSTIDHSTDNWKIKVCVSRKWKVFDFESHQETMRIDMILIDEEGQQVHATIPKRFIMKFVSLLQEGCVFLISNFNVSKTTNNYRPVPNDYRIYFKWDTIVRLISVLPPTFPKYRFYFVDFVDISLRYNNNTFLTDVVGRLHSFSRVKKIPKKEGQDSILRELTLESESGSKLKVSLWGSAVDLIQDSIVDHIGGSPVLVVTSSTVKKFNDNFYLSSTSATKIFIDLDIPEVQFFKKSYEDTVVKLLDAPSSSQVDMEKRPYNNRKMIADILQIITENSFEGHKYTCRAVITHVIHDFEPFYYACNECHRKVSSEGYSYWCSFCNKEGSDPTPRFKIKVKIEDGGCASEITIFDKEVERMLCRPVTDIIKIIESENGSSTVKDILNTVIGEFFVFELKINRRKFHHNITHVLTATKVFEVDALREVQNYPNVICAAKSSDKDATTVGFEVVDARNSQQKVMHRLDTSGEKEGHIHMEGDRPTAELSHGATTNEKLPQILQLEGGLVPSNGPDTTVKSKKSKRKLKGIQTPEYDITMVKRETSMQGTYTQLQSVGQSSENAISDKSDISLNPGRTRRKLTYKGSEN